MTSVGTLGGSAYDWSRAYGVSADGTTVVGQSTTSSAGLHAFKHVTFPGGSTLISDLGVLTGGTDSMAKTGHNMFGRRRGQLVRGISAGCSQWKSAFPDQGL
jgi:probable HAF family extracellular repeat protein